MKLIKSLPWTVALTNSDGTKNQDSELDAAVFTADENICEMKQSGCCDTCGMYYGSSNEADPKFCAKHYYHANAEEGSSHPDKYQIYMI